MVLLAVALLLLVFNAMMAVWVGTVAKDKGFEGAWGTYGFLAWPFALGLVMIAPPNPAVLEREGIRAGTLRKCPSCAETVRMEAKKCRYCAEPLPVIEKKPRSAFKRTIH